MLETDSPLALVATIAVLLFAVLALEFGGVTGLLGGAGSDTPTPTPAAFDATSEGVPDPISATSTPAAGDGNRLLEPPGDPGDRPDRVARKAGEYDRATELIDPDGYFNTAGPISLQQFVGEKVILVEFWTYSCYNCQNTHPHIKEYYRTYRDDGLVVVGIHAPEFDYEKRPSNVRGALRETNTSYPVVLDNDHATWAAWDQRYWPTRYLIGIDGFVRYTHIGEGAYNETDRKIRELLRERQRVLEGNETG